MYLELPAITGLLSVFKRVKYFMYFSLKQDLVTFVPINLKSDF